MVRVRHLKHKNLETLEKMIGKVKLPIILNGAPFFHDGEFYQSFIIQGIPQETLKAGKIEIAKETETRKV